ncbi:MAG: glycosyltransferase family 4 protein [Cytophagales bacterium]|nr:glycosyltransferase family 4 protein [Cytophagales bacterium]MDW8384886.1 glycosyltransferase [Flammeovirgaceae bacterium]
MSEEKQPKVLFIKGRPDAHPIHALYADAVKADHIFEDFILRWHDKPQSSHLRRYASWFFCAFNMPKSYDVYLAECVRFPVVISRKIGIISRKQKIITIVDDESLYYIYSNQYPKTTIQAMKWYLKNNDGLICIGEFQTWLAKEILKDECPPLVTAFNGIKKNRLEKLQKNKFNPMSRNILHISNFGMNFRLHYKGLDLMVKAFDEARKILPDIKFYIIGQNDEDAIRYLLDLVSEETRHHIIFTGRVENIESYFQDAALYLHTARGEAFGISILEAMAASVPVLISEVTGVREIVKRVAPSFVVPLDVEHISKQIVEYFTLNVGEKVELSQRSKSIASLYSEDYAKESFLEAFQQVTNQR